MEGQTRRTRHKTQKKQDAPKGGKPTLFLILDIWKFNKQKTLRRGKHTGYENYLLYVYSKLQKAPHMEENKGYENANLKIKL